MTRLNGYMRAVSLGAPRHTALLIISMRMSTCRNMVRRGIRMVSFIILHSCEVRLLLGIVRHTLHDAFFATLPPPNGRAAREGCGSEFLRHIPVFAFRLLRFFSLPPLFPPHEFVCFKVMLRRPIRTARSHLASLFPGQSSRKCVSNGAKRRRKRKQNVNREIGSCPTSCAVGVRPIQVRLTRTATRGQCIKVAFRRFRNI